MIAKEVKKMTAKERAKNAHKKVAGVITDQLKRGVRPWQKPWDGTGALLDGLPIRASTGSKKTPYKGINVWSLMLFKASEGFKSDEWGTFDFWKKEAAKHAVKKGEFKEVTKKDGGTWKKPTAYYGVKKGQASFPVVFYEMKSYTNEVEDEKTGEKKNETRSVWIQRFFMVFNKSQTGLPIPKKKKPTKKETETAKTEAEEHIDSLLKEHKIDFREGGGSAFYNMAVDYIQVPERKRFKTPTGRCATISHEMAHWTGHPERLDRDMSGRFGSEDYAYEELVAEMSASMMCIALGIEDTSIEENMENHAAYMKSWLKAIKDAKDDGQKFIFSAASKAQKVCEYLLPEYFGVEAKE